MSVGEAILGAFLQVVLQQVYKLINSKIVAAEQLEADLESLKTSLERIRDILAGVERRQSREDDLQSWLRHLRDVAYDANDVLDEISTEGLRRDAIQHFPEDMGALSDLNPMRKLFHHKIGKKVRQTIKRIEDITRNNALLPPEAASGGSSAAAGYGPGHDTGAPKPTTGNLSSDTPVFGREAETAKLVPLLITDDYSVGNISVIPVPGIGGIGKTTVAQLVYNHEAVSQCFDVKMWVHVPPRSDATKLTKLILESVAGPTNHSDLNSLQCELKMWLSGSRYLLVLDNLWNERRQTCNEISEDWAELRKPLLDGAPGSRILITTRNLTTAKFTSTVGHPNQLLLDGLSFNACWSVFAHHAFEDRAKTERNGELAKIGMRIASKCCGSPMAARTLGSHLRAAEKRNWEYIAESHGILRLQESRDGILRSLESTYHQLPPPVKQCFRFCGIFPNGFEFEEGFLVRLWMAQGFILPQGRERVEDTGSRYFNDLVDQLFLRRASGDPSKYVMSSDLISELAQIISHDECCMVDQQNKSSGSVSESIRHASSSPQPAAIRSFYNTRGLYTLVLIGECSTSMLIPDKMAETLKRLRVLDLGNVDIEMLDGSVGKLIHLRYLGLSSGKIKSLPESVCNLYNLQTLSLRNCTGLENLPENIKLLSNLRHLDLQHDYYDFQVETVSALRSMPKDIGKLRALQTLTRFVVGGERRNCGGMKELRDLTGIHGDLHLRDLHHIRDGREAQEANLSNKKHLTRLELQWGYDSSPKGGRTEESIILANLEPHTNLEVLWIGGYNGASFPQWVGRPSFSNLVKIRLSYCRTCEQLPPLGQLPSLEELHIQGMDSVECVDCGFCGGSNTRSIGFPRLKKLSFEHMRNWKCWFGAKTCRLPSLRQLVIKDCPLLGNNIYHPLPTGVLPPMA